MGWKEEATKQESKSQKLSKESILSKFKPANELEPVNSLKVGIFGQFKTGKSTFTLSAPKPIYIIDTEKSSNILLQMVPESERADIHVLDVMEYTDKRDSNGKLNLTMSLELVEEAINELHDLAKNSESGVCGSVILDSASDLWEFLKTWMNEDVSDKKMTKSGSVMQTEWSKPNARYTEVMRLLIKSGWNVILTFRADEVFGSSGERLGIFKAKGQKDTLYWVDQILETKKVGDSYSVVFHGGRFGNITDEISDPTWDKVCNRITTSSGVKFKK